MPLWLGIQMDTPSTRQTRTAYVSTPTREPAFPHGSRSGVRDGLASPPSSAVAEERQEQSALSVEQRGVAALPDGHSADVSLGSNVRRPVAGVSRPAFASSRNTLSSESTLDRLHTLHHRDVLPMGGVTEYLIRTCASIGSTSSHSHMHCYADP